jgi:hypothetical protein
LHSGILGYVLVTEGLELLACWPFQPWSANRLPRIKPGNLPVEQNSNSKCQAKQISCDTLAAMTGFQPFGKKGKETADSNTRE